MVDGLVRERPFLPFRGLDTLWLQVTGTVCNIACRHCLVSAGPKVLLHRPMPVEACVEAIDEGVRHGLREVWFTGGEPFLHPRLLDIVDHALERVAVGILTNGMLVDDAMAEDLGRRFRGGRHNLEIRVSLDGATAEANDLVRGPGVFAAATAGIAALARHGAEPIVAVTLLDGGVDRAAFVTLLRDLGVARPRMKWIPAFHIGREAGRGGAYADGAGLVAEDLVGDEAGWRLSCGTSRTVTSEGVYPCPILVNERGRRLAGTLGEALAPHPVDHAACATCFAEGFSCAT